MNSPQALSTVYAIAAQALSLSEPLESLEFENPVPYARVHLVTATSNVTNLDVASVLDDNVEEDTVLQACGLVLAKAVQNTAPTPAEVLDVFKQAFVSLINEYCELARAPVRHFHNVVSVADALALEVATIERWPHSGRRRRHQ